MNPAGRSRMEDKSIADINSVINAYDLTAIEDMDPSLSDGFKVIYDREIPLELRLQDVSSDPQDVGTLESIRARILAQGDLQNPQVIKIEFTSESDLFFNYGSIIDESIFQKVREEQKLNVEFQGFLSLLIKMCNSCQKEPQNYFAVFFMQRDGQAKLDFIQNMEYKFLELLSVDFMAAPEDIIRQNIGYRYSLLKAKAEIMQNRLRDVSQILKLKNPSLLLQLQKGAQAGSTQRSTFHP